VALYSAYTSYTTSVAETHLCPYQVTAYSPPAHPSSHQQGLKLAYIKDIACFLIVFNSIPSEMLTSAELLAQPSSRLPIACLSVKLLTLTDGTLCFGGNATTDTDVLSIFLVRLCRFLTSLTHLPQQSDFHLSVHFPFP